MSEEKRYLSDIPLIKEYTHAGHGREIYIPAGEFPTHIGPSAMYTSPFAHGVILVRCATNRTRFQIWRVDDAGAIETLFDGHILPDEFGRLCFDKGGWREPIDRRLKNQCPDRNEHGYDG